MRVNVHKDAQKFSLSIHGIHAQLHVNGVQVWAGRRIDVARRTEVPALVMLDLVRLWVAQQAQSQEEESL